MAAPRTTRPRPPPLPRDAAGHHAAADQRPAAPANTGGGTWATGTAYRTGDEVTFQGQRYRCRQSHTSLSGWEPSIFTLALWLPV
ncbi:hypothetical protein Psuf_074790 [Phytohabitans suffuscus]|uniref:Chitin-binding type-3 domain-containing protein n=1 Tax=Phytohabitans suffuscus TaxID=624315 RepID=A0A6F8YVT7_9ACTN|nr:carbohydrate-binding protein [Phytohabitans suffuscus]BCB90166.1 hypothetical protein Psuf_074790 [Phytohabitans suffuscus]